jgi:hypothetical protein
VGNGSLGPGGGARVGLALVSKKELPLLTKKEKYPVEDTYFDLKNKPS